MEDDIMNQLIMALLVLSAIFFVLGGLSRFLRFQILGHEPTVWWRGSMSFLGFSVALMLWQIGHMR